MTVDAGFDLMPLVADAMTVSLGIFAIYLIGRGLALYITYRLFKGSK